MNIFQVLTSFEYGGNIWNDVLTFDRALKEMGYHTHIFSTNIDTRTPKNLVSDIKEMPDFKEKDVVIYHFADGCELNQVVAALGCRIIFRIHNSLFSDQSNQYLLKNIKKKSIELKNMMAIPDYCLFSTNSVATEFKGYGVTCPIDIVPISIPFDDYDTLTIGSTPNFNHDGWINIVFVGSVIPDHKQEDILKIFTHYKTYVNPFSRLILMSQNSESWYFKNLKEYEKTLAVEDVIWKSYTKFEEVLNFYQIADVFLCMSEQEGVYAPLVEAMYFEIPVIAFKTPSIADTMQNDGVLVDSKEPVFVSSVIDYIVKNNHAIDEIRQIQSRIVPCYQFEIVKDKIFEFMTEFNRKIEEDKESIKELQRQAKSRDECRIIYDMTLAHKQLAEGYCTGIQRVSYELYQSMSKKVNILPVTSMVEFGQIVYYELNKLTLQSTNKQIKFTPADILLRPELNDSLASLKKVKKSGARVYVMVHDLLPIRLPQFFEREAFINFKTFINWIALYGDGCICVSKAVSDDFAKYIEEENIPLDASFKINYSHNGVKPLAKGSSVVSDEISFFFNDDTPVFFMLATVEPRKNHELVLDVMEQFWKNGYNYKLCIIGRVGWKVERLVKRIKNHGELGNRLVFWDQASDDVVTYVYQNATALIQASFGEGFGLPLIEAGFYDLPILCSDIPVFREVAGEFALYFDPNNRESLSDCITEFMEAKEQGILLSSKNIPTSTWDEAAERIFEIIMN